MHTSSEKEDEYTEFLETAKDKILIVDDEAVNVYIIQKYLEKNNYLYDVANSGEEAIEAVRKSEYSAVLLDVIMPGMNGFETCKKIHTIRPRMPVMILTALVDDDSIRYSFHSGAIDYLKKPINETELIVRLENIIKMHRAEKKLKNLYRNVMNDLELSAEIQSYMLPNWFLNRRNLQASSMYIPSNQVGGDLYDIITLDENCYVVYIGDISGHGVQAALLMTAVKSIIHELVLAEKENIEPYAIVNKLNKIFTKNLFKQSYITLLFSVIDIEKAELRLYNAGHPPLLAIGKKCEESGQKNREVQVLGAKGGCPLGWIDDFEYKKEDEVSVSFTADTQFLFYTDGVYECLNKQGDILGLNALKACIQTELDTDQPFLLPQQIYQAIQEKGYNISFDDFALLSVQNGLLEKDEQPGAKQQRLFVTKNDLPKVAEIGKEMEATVLKWTKDKEFSMRVELAANEVLNNIIIHSYGGLDSQNTTVDLIVAQIQHEKVKENGYDKISLRFFHKGKKWDMSTIVKQKLLEEEDFLSDSGRGIRIIMKLSTDFVNRQIGEIEELMLILQNNPALDMDMPMETDESCKVPVLHSTENSSEKS